MKTLCIIQARMTSSRLPGKSMMILGGKPVIRHVIDKAKQIKSADNVVVAYPRAEASNPLRLAAISAGVLEFQGSEHDVLDRYHKAATHYKADIVIRITGDCPFIDPDVVDRVVALRRKTGSEYASNVHPRSFPRGLDCEVFTMNMLTRAHLRASEPEDREHVTPWMIRNAPRVNVASGHFGLDKINWCVDTAEDLARLNRIIEDNEPTTIEEYVRALDRSRGGRLRSSKSPDGAADALAQAVV